MNGWKLTRVWDIDGQLFVAESIEKAIELYRIYMGKENHLFESAEIKGITGRRGTMPYDAIIKED